jgi:hypothetical protein
MTTPFSPWGFYLRSGAMAGYGQASPHLTNHPAAGTPNGGQAADR